MRALLLCSLVLAIGGCRADSGPDDYASQERLRLDAEPPPIDADIEPGERRFALGIFYEGPADESVTIDGVSAHFYIYEDTFAASVEEADRVEGAVSDRLVLRGGPWWGGGVHWDTPRDLSGWTSRAAPRWPPRSTSCCCTPTRCGTASRWTRRCRGPSRWWRPSRATTRGCPS